MHTDFDTGTELAPACACDLWNKNQRPFLTYWSHSLDEDVSKSFTGALSPALACACWLWSQNLRPDPRPSSDYWTLEATLESYYPWTHLIKTFKILYRHVINQHLHAHTDFEDRIQGPLWTIKPLKPLTIKRTRTMKRMRTIDNQAMDKSFI
jgi:hypothetical protein